jgi:hypothetical protein
MSSKCRVRTWPCQNNGRCHLNLQPPTQFCKLSRPRRRAELRQPIGYRVPRGFGFNIEVSNRVQRYIDVQGRDNQADHSPGRRVVIQPSPTSGAKTSRGIERFYFVAGKQLLPLRYGEPGERHEQQSRKSCAMRFATKPTMTVDDELQVVVDDVSYRSAQTATLMHRPLLKGPVSGRPGLFYPDSATVSPR